MVTVRTIEVVDLMPLSEALMDDVPVVNAVARPMAEIEATAGVAEAQVVSDVRSMVGPLVNVPTAVNCVVNPLAMLAPAVNRAIDFRPTVNTIVCEPMSPSESFAMITTTPALGVVGAPLKSPERERVRPVGSVPWATEKMYGPLPPWAANWLEIFTFGDKLPIDGAVITTGLYAVSL